MFIQTKEFDVISIKYPHIAKKIMLLWGSYDMHQYFLNLLYDTRDGKRQGFPVHDYLCIIRICNIHRKNFPKIFKVNIYSGKPTENIRNKDTNIGQ
jgi:hypothetical protein